MADNVTLPGIGEVVATDQASDGKHYQKVKLTEGVADSTTLITPLQHGTDITGASMPAGGSYGMGWLSAIWKMLSDRLPSVLVGGRLDVNVGNVSTHDSAVGSDIFLSGGIASSTAPTAVTANDAARIWTDLNGRQVITSGTTAALADGSATPTTFPIGSYGMLYNGSTWDFHRGNVTVDLVPYASPTTLTTGTYSSGALTNHNCDGVQITVFLKTVTTAGSGFIIQIVGLSSPSGAGATVLCEYVVSAGNTVVNRSFTLQVKPGCSVVPTAPGTGYGIVATTAAFLPKTWYVYMVGSASLNIQFNLAYNLSKG